MKTCEKCAVTVAGDAIKCPLCQNALTEEEQEQDAVFPFIPIVKYEYSLLYRILQLCSAFAVIVSCIVNWMFPKSGLWSLFVVAGVACVWISISIAVRKRHNILKNMAYQVSIISVLSVLWDLFTGWRGWSTDFVIPIAFACAMVATTILARVLKMQVGDYIIYLFLLILYGIIPTAFVLSGLSGIVYPSLICVAGSLLSLAVLLIFEGKNMIEELKRRLHL